MRLLNLPVGQACRVGYGELKRLYREVKPRLQETFHAAGPSFAPLFLATVGMPVAMMTSTSGIGGSGSSLTEKEFKVELEILNEMGLHLRAAKKCSDLAGEFDVQEIGRAHV